MVKIGAVDIFKGTHCTVCTDSLGGATIGKVQAFNITIANGLTPHYEAGTRTPYTIKEGNQLISGSLGLHFRDKTEVLDLVTASPIAYDTLYVQATDGVSTYETVDLTLNNLKWGDWSMSFDNTGTEVIENCTWICLTITEDETTN